MRIVISLFAKMPPYGGNSAYSIIIHSVLKVKANHASRFIINGILTDQSPSLSISSIQRFAPSLTSSSSFISSPAVPVTQPYTVASVVSCIL